MAERSVMARNGVVIRRLRRTDETEWLALRRDNRSWLRPWEATPPPGEAEPAVSFASYLRHERRQTRARTLYSMVIVVDKHIVGRVAVTSVRWGAERGGSLGYWVQESHAGRGITPTAAALLTEHVFREGLHRVEIAVRPDNIRSIRVAEKLGFRDEGMRASYLYIDGAWRDHRVFALTESEPRMGEFWAPRS